MDILVVDDIELNRVLLRHMIERKDGMDIVSEAENGVISIEMVKVNDYDIIFMDMMMPKMSGYEATKRIKEIKPHIPIYIVSAYKEDDFPNDWKNGDYDGILSKPVGVHLITDILKKHSV